MKPLPLRKMTEVGFGTSMKTGYGVLSIAEDHKEDSSSVSDRQIKDQNEYESNPDQNSNL